MPISNYLSNLRRKIGNDLVLMPAVTAVVFHTDGKILVQRAKDDGQWYVPGGGLEPGESPADAAVREIAEETSIRAEPLWMVGVYVDPLAVYASGDIVQYVSICFACRAIGGEPRVNDDESLEVKWAAMDELPPLAGTHRLRVEQAVRQRDEPALRAAYLWEGQWTFGIRRLE